MVLLNLRSLNKLNFNLDILIPNAYNTPTNKLLINRIIATFFNVPFIIVLIVIFLYYMMSNNLSTYLPLIVIVSVITLYNILIFFILLYSNYSDTYLKQPKMSGDKFDDTTYYCYEYCQTCQSYKLNRTHHSKKLNCCIYKFDHFCQWLGIVINYGNYKLFLQYIILNLINCLIVFVVSLYRLVMLRQWIGLSIMYLALSALFLLALISLVAVHRKLIYTNQTTVEFLNYRWLKKHDTQNGIIYSPILQNNGNLEYISIKDCNIVYTRDSFISNIRDALGPINIFLLLPTLNSFQTLNLEVSNKLKEQYKNVYKEN